MTESIRNIKLFEDNFNCLYTGLVVYAERFTCNTKAAEDVVHDSFTSLWQKLQTMEPKNIKAYLFSTVRNNCLNYISGLKVRNNYQSACLKKGDIGGLLTWEYFVEGELAEHIQNAIDALPPQCRKVFIMNRFDNKSAEEIAKELGISQATVRKHIEIAIKHLRKDLSEYLPLSLIMAIVC